MDVGGFNVDVFEPMSWRDFYLLIGIDAARCTNFIQHLSILTLCCHFLEISMHHNICRMLVTLAI
jgi:hypothetical protein